jgi:uncharacterized membrane protein YgdD (TMEM256/DUF423 family)
MDVTAFLLWTMAGAGLMGMAGIALAAAGAHGRPGTGLDGAGYILLLHAAAVIAVGTAVDAEILHDASGILAVLAFVLGAALFAGDVTLRVYRARRLFPMAAPTGGMVLIAGWLMVTVSALGALAAIG